jgi:hypothetical protein
MSICLMVPTGPGKHLKGLTLMDGVVQPEEFDYFRMSFSLRASVSGAK